jgi:lipopolysaccharide biosynthesis glycosyltransferase
VRLDVACAAEGAEYLAHSAAMLHSLLSHHAEHDVYVHYLHGGDIPPRLEAELAAMVVRDGGAISFIRVPDRAVRGLPTKDFTRKATWYRIFLPELRPAVDRVLYLDADLIVTDSLAPLFELDLTGHWVGAVTNVLQHNHFHRPAELGLAGPEVYFNAGVLLMNLAEMRRDGRTRALLDYGRANADRLEWRDQDALNVVLGSRRLALHPRWNCMNSLFAFAWAADVFGEASLREALGHPAIRHFEGPSVNKPWHEQSASEQRELYVQHRRATPWADSIPDGVRPPNLLRRLTRRRVVVSA